MIKIRQPYCFSEIGLKDNQEDYLYPRKADTDTRVFIMCDGMGGHDNGEVASRTAAETLGKNLITHREIDTKVFEAALGKAYEALDAIDTHSGKTPGTTMTCLCLNSDSYLVAHIGDSRIYHIRPSRFNRETGRGGIIYQSSDHSLVNDLLKAGEITEEEARDFPQKNIITKAMQPNLENRCKADIFLFDDIRKGDYFFLCCDGVLEQLSNETLCSILAEDGLSDRDKMDRIKSVCDRGTRDNYTAWLVPIDDVELQVKGENSQVIQAIEEIVETPTTKPVKETPKPVKESPKSEAVKPEAAKPIPEKEATKAETVKQSLGTGTEKTAKRRKYTDRQIMQLITIGVLLITCIAIIVWIILKLTIWKDV